MINVKKIKTKICFKCHRRKPVNEFNKNKIAKGGLQEWCKVCKAAYWRIYYQEHKVEEIERQKKYQSTHKVEIAARQKKYRQEHKVEQAERYKEYHHTINGYLRYRFSNMKQRCNNPKVRNYKDYGGRGIKVKFASVNEFIDYVVNELKVDPRGFEIDRIDNNGHYEPGNIRFVTCKINNNNRRDNK